MAATVRDRVVVGVGWRGLTALVGGGLSEPVAGRGRYAGDAMMRA